MTRPRHRAARPRGRRMLRVAAATIALAAVVGATWAAWGFWTAPVAPGSSGAAAASTVGDGARPTVTASANTVTVTWPRATLADGAPVTGYMLRRFSTFAGDGTSDTVGSSPDGTCAGTVTATTCSDTVPDGTWSYTVTPVVGTRWRGATSPPSASVLAGTGPTGGSVTVQGRVGTGAAYVTSLTPTVTLDPGTDKDGLAPGVRLLRARASLTSTSGGDGACGTFADPVVVATDPAASYVDTLPTGAACYRYTLLAADRYGNGSTVTSNPVKVDVTAPSTPVLTLTPDATTAAYVNGSQVFVRTGSSGTLTARATATDAESGITTTTWSDVAGWPGTRQGTTATYAWSETTTSGGTATATVTNNAGLRAKASFQLVTDGDAPVNGSVSYADGFITGSRARVALVDGTDGGAGVSTTPGSRVLQRAAAPLANGVCGDFEAFATVVNGIDPPNPRLDPVDPGFCYRYRYLVRDFVGNVRVNTSDAVVKAIDSGYAKAVKATPGLRSYWRIGEPTMVYDSFSGTAGALLTTRSPDVGAAWRSHQQTSTYYPRVVFTPQGRVRRGDPSTADYGQVYLSSLNQDRTDYTVEGELFYASDLLNDGAGLTTRIDGVTASGYGGGYDAATKTWQIQKMMLAAKSTIAASAPESLTPGSTYHLALDVHGDRIRLLVNGVERAQARDDAVRIGTGGIYFGFGAGQSAVPTDATGMHLDNVRITPSMRDEGPAAQDGIYLGAPAMGAAGAPSQDLDTAGRFDGLNDRATVPVTLAQDTSLELWFATARGSGTTWRDAAGLAFADAEGSDRDLGIGVNADGAVVAGTGDVALASAGRYADDTWHHAVLTRGAGRLVLYVDGRPEAAQDTAVVEAAPATLTLGRGPGGGALAGVLDEAAVYDSALSADKVAEHVAAR